MTPSRALPARLAPLAPLAMTLLGACVSSTGIPPEGVATADATDSTDDAVADEGAQDAADAAPDTPPEPVCGDGIVEGAEQCDNGSDNSDTSANACRADCRLPFCGDGVVDDGEACDDGQPDANDFCTSACRRVETDLCEPCNDDALCGGELDGCVALEDGGACGLSCLRARDCPEGFLCADTVSFAGAPIRHCVPASGVCVDCFDPDRDGFGSGSACTAPDCDQTDGAIRPGADEVCDGADNDCDGLVDEDSEPRRWFVDLDDDGRGAQGTEPRADCRELEGYAPNDDDCNDRNRLVYIGAAELCDRVDNDCDGLVDDGASSASFWRDSDGDGYGDPGSAPVTTCAPPSGTAPNQLDCNDARADVNPSRAESCGNGADDDCDGAVDCADGVCAGTSACSSGCDDDRLEDDDTLESATLISAQILDLVACDDDSDWFRMPLVAGDTVSIVLAFVHDNGDIDLLLVDATGRLVASSTGVVDSESVEVGIDEGGEYFARVYLYEDYGEPGSSYALTYERR